MQSKPEKRWAWCLLSCLLFPALGWAQSFNASISGAVTDPSGAVVPYAELTLTAIGTEAVMHFATGPDGLYRFGNLQTGPYELRASAKGFREFVQRGIAVNINETVRVDVKLELGPAQQTVEVTANASPLNFENAEVKQAITPQTIQDLPLLVAGARRSAASFVILMPGVTTGGGNAPFDARINGGLQSGDEAVLDGVTMQDGLDSQSGLVEALTDAPLSPEAIGEISILTSNYEPQYGSTSSGVITAVTKSGTDKFHGGAFEFLRNRALNSRQFGVPGRPLDIENDYGFNIGGPVKIPKLGWTARRRTYFFFNFEGFKKRGGLVVPILSIPSLKERKGDFSDWVDSQGNLIPVYDPNTTRPNPLFNASQPEGPSNLPFLRDQFMGCNGNTPNVICPSDPRLASSLAPQWLQFLPTPSFDRPRLNYVSPVAQQIGGVNDANQINLRADSYFGEKDHVSVTVFYAWFPQVAVSFLPKQISGDGMAVGTPHRVLDRLIWDHTFSPSFLNNINLGYNDPLARNSCIDKPFAATLPQIPGVVSHDYPPAISLQGFAGMGCNDDRRKTRPLYDVNDFATWVRGRHTFRYGGEFRTLAINQITRANRSGSFSFAPISTGLIGLNSGNSVASFLLEQVASANVDVRTLEGLYPRQHAWNLHLGDTWRATSKLSINYGVRWDVFQPSFEKYDHSSCLDPLGSNPEAGNRPGRLAFAGTRWGAASFGRRHAELTWFRGFAPRLGIAYSASPKTVVRTGYGIFFSNAFYPQWAGGISQQGFNATYSLSSTMGGLQPAFILSQGLPPDPNPPPFIDPGFRNGKSILYRPFEANRLPYSQQWNLTIEHQFTNDFYISTAYVGNKGTRLLSQIAPLNALNPQLLSMGQQLYDEFQPGQTVLDGVPIPYSGWVQQMKGCAPSVAQALLPYPQYCDTLQGLNENAGNSTYHSLQLKAEKRFSHGIWMLTSYTASKLLTTSDNTQEVGLSWSTVTGVISPFERQHNKALAVDDVPQLLSLALIYQLPFGQGQRFANRGGVGNKLVGGWMLSNIYRASSGTPFYFRSNNCNLPGQFAVSACIPAILPGASPWAQSKGSFNPGLPLFNAAAFENSGPAGFNFDFGHGPRISNLRGFGFQNHDVALIKGTRVTERVSVQFRAEFFNIWNWHNFSCENQCYGETAFDQFISDPTFGMWDGTVTPPRNIQFGLKVLF